MEQDQSQRANLVHLQYLALTLVWTLTLSSQHLLPAPLLVTLLVLTVLLLLVTAFRIQSRT